MSTENPCPDCQAPNRARALFCASCGARMRPARAAPARVEAPTATVPAESRRLRGFLASFDFDPAGEGFVLRLGQNVLGRDPRSCQVLLAGDPRVSRQHCVVNARAGEVTLEDLGSEHGTLVNGARVGNGAVPLRDGDVIQLCGYKLLVKLVPA